MANITAVLLNGSLYLKKKIIDAQRLASQCHYDSGLNGGMVYVRFEDWGR
ncbi:hypothetical protein OAC57_05290 [Planktomarina temperata]|nr:hypothetical protein [Planktomarina temperata]